MARHHFSVLQILHKKTKRRHNVNQFDFFPFSIFALYALAATMIGISSSCLGTCMLVYLKSHLECSWPTPSQHSIDLVTPPWSLVCIYRVFFSLATSLLISIYPFHEFKPSILGLFYFIHCFFESLFSQHDHF